MRAIITMVLSWFGIGQRVCGWCRAHMGYKRVVGGHATHGMCVTCKARWDADLDKIEAERQSHRQYRSRRNLRRSTGGWSGAVALHS